MQTLKLFLIFCIFTLYPASIAHGLEAVLALHWLPQAQFTGYYMAREKGFYSDEGLDVTILPGGPDLVPADRLVSGEATFATMFLAAGIERRVAGIPLVNIGQVGHHSSLMILTQKKDNINELKDLNGKMLGVWSNDFQLQPWALFKQHNLEVYNVPFNGSVEIFLRGGVPATLAMWYNEYHTVLSAGLRPDDLKTFFFKDTDFDFPEDGIYCLEQTLDEYPDKIDGFIRASIKGWQYSFNHKEEALAVIKKKMNEAKIPFSKVHQSWMLSIMEKIMTPYAGPDLSSKLSEESFYTVMDTIIQSGFSDIRVNYQDFVWSAPDAQ